MLKGFKDFLMRGNVVDLAVAVVIGRARGIERATAAPSEEVALLTEIRELLSATAR